METTFNYDEFIKCIFDYIGSKRRILQGTDLKKGFKVCEKQKIQQLDKSFENKMIRGNQIPVTKRVHVKDYVGYDFSFCTSVVIDVGSRYEFFKNPSNEQDMVVEYNVRSTSGITSDIVQNISFGVNNMFGIMNGSTEIDKYMSPIKLFSCFFDNSYILDFFSKLYGLIGNNYMINDDNIVVTYDIVARGLQIFFTNFILNRDDLVVPYFCRTCLSNPTIIMNDKDDDYLLFILFISLALYKSNRAIHVYLQNMISEREKSNEKRDKKLARTVDPRGLSTKKSGPEKIPDKKLNPETILSTYINNIKANFHGIYSGDDIDQLFSHIKDEYIRLISSSTKIKIYE